MDRRLGFPILINVITELFHLFRDLVSSDWSMFASAYPDSCRTEVARIRADALKRYAMKMQEVTGAKFKRPLFIEEIINHFHYSIELTQRISRFLAR